MKKHLLLTLILFLGFHWQSKACIDPDSVVVIIVNYDTQWVAATCPYAEEVEIRLSNIRLMSEAPNKICACGLASFADNFSVLRYVAFVDSGTNNPYNGFGDFIENALASDEWDNADPGSGSWAGLIADVINGGLSATTPVEMVIRAEAPPGTQLVFDSLCSANQYLPDLINQASLGTDAWDPVNETLDASHQSVRSLDASQVAGSSVSYAIVSSQYMDDLDDDILDNIPADTNTCNANFSYTADGFEVTLTDESNTDALQFLRWDLGNGEIIEAFEGTTYDYTNSGEGTYTVCVENINNGSVCDSHCEEIVVGPAGIESVGIASRALSVFPNPAKDQLKVRSSHGILQNVQVLDLLGREVASLPLDASGVADVTEIHSGMYFLRANWGNLVLKSEMVIITH